MVGNRRIFPLPMAWVGDMMEQYYLQGLTGPGAAAPSITWLTAKAELTNLDAPRQHRTQAQAAQVSLTAECSNLADWTEQDQRTRVSQQAA